MIFPSATVESQLLPKKTQFYVLSVEWCLKAFMKYKTAFKNNGEEPEAFYIPLTGWAIVGKSFLINVITEYVKRNLKYHGQKLQKSPIGRLHYRQGSLSY